MQWLDDVMHDLRLAVRMLRRDGGFAAAAVLTLAAGIGLAVAMLAVSNVVLRTPLPVHDQDRVVVLWAEAEGSVRHLPLTFPHFQRFREEARTLDEVAGALSASGWIHAVRDGDRTLSWSVAAVTGNFFRVLGSGAVLGRTLQPEDDVIGAAPVTVISHALWRREFGGRPDVIGRRLTLHQRRLTYTVIGVAAPGLEFPTGADFWVPLVPFARLEVVPVGRLAPNATPDLAAGELRASFDREARSYLRGIRATARPLPELILGDVRPALLLLSAAAALLLLIACVNVANLLLARTSARAHEIAVRRALGAGRGRILRQMLVEPSILALTGGLLGTLSSFALLRGLLALAPPELPRLEDVGLVGIPLGIAAAITFVAAFVISVVPALALSASVASPLQRMGTRSSTESKRRLRTQHALVVLQVGVVTIMLTAAGLLARSLRELERLDVGFTPDRILVVQLTWPDGKFENLAKVTALYDRLLPGIEALPDVAGVAPVNLEPFTGAAGGWDGWFVAEGPGQAQRATTPVFNMAAVGPDYFRTLGLPILRGRGFTEADREGSLRVAVVSDAVARLLWPGQDPVSRRIGFGTPATPDDWWTVVGVVPETRYRILREAAPTVYLPFRQFAEVRYLVVRTNSQPAAAVPSIRQALKLIDPDVLVLRADPIERLLSKQLVGPLFNVLLVGVFGAGALLLAAVGLYAVLAYVVRRRARELAIRHALGASRQRLRSTVLGQGLGLVAIGVLLGIATSLAGGRLIRSLLFGVSPADPLTLAGVAAILVVVALAASYIPAHRATRSDPAAVLRDE